MHVYAAVAAQGLVRGDIVLPLPRLGLMVSCVDHANCHGILVFGIYHTHPLFSTVSCL
jgi:hypothetical protein